MARNTCVVLRYHHVSAGQGGALAERVDLAVQCVARPVRAFLYLAVGASCLAIDATCQSKDARFSDDKHIKDGSAQT
jgi:hypothetical protein